VNCHTNAALEALPTFQPSSEVGHLILSIKSISEVSQMNCCLYDYKAQNQQLLKHQTYFKIIMKTRIFNCNIKSWIITG